MTMNVKSEKDARKWNISNIYQGHIDTSKKYAIVVLNRSILLKPDFMIKLWNNAFVRITVDGGTVRWDKYLNSLPLEVQKSVKKPDLVTGDFDSITDEVLAKYTNEGSKIINTPDQCDTDFTKALMELNTYSQQHNIELDYVLTITQNSGRIDQILGNIQTLFLVKEKKIFSDRTKVYLLCENFLAWLLLPGYHVVDIPKDILEQRKPICSLIPVGEECRSVTTTGLMWNLDNGKLKFGELISTSNTFDGSEQVTINCSNTLMWTVKVPVEIDFAS
ncbi:thiamin pyrophosphokinase 1 [Aricia agestis]|uniref:thiamin pyrophosphokinase 1 n=1 Tax=Aricia agestis TaxID=91739 RepID=UPI001C207ED1|nr:thiamin pyrophosphokinase 1 [Aricia agestis]XP_041970339.1 thiamin pyrophosphokinase 1 [Aricia agestis]